MRRNEINCRSLRWKRRENTECVYYQQVVYVKIRYKGKAIPLQALTGPEDSRRLRLPDFKTIGI
jgi:hypothetical protein